MFRQTSEKRREYLSEYLEFLLAMNEAISESDVVYTFLHCLMRDEQDLRVMKEGKNGRLPVLFSRLYLCCLIRYTFETSTNQFGFKMHSTDVKIRTLAPREDGKRDDRTSIEMHGIVEFAIFS